MSYVIAKQILPRSTLLRGTRQNLYAAVQDLSGLHISNGIYRTLVVGIIIRKVREGIQQAVQSGTLLLFILLHKSIS